MKWLLTAEYGLINLDWFSQISVVDGKVCLTCPDGAILIDASNPDGLLFDIADFLGSEETVLSVASTELPDEMEYHQ